MTNVSRLIIDHPDFAQTGGNALHTQVEDGYIKIGDNIGTRFFTTDALADTASADFVHNLKTNFNEITFRLFNRNTGTGELTLIRAGGTPDLDDFIIVGSPGLLTTSIRVTNNSGSPQDLALGLSHSNVPQFLNIGIPATETQGQQSRLTVQATSATVSELALLDLDGGDLLSIISNPTTEVTNIAGAGFDPVTNPAITIDEAGFIGINEADPDGVLHVTAASSNFQLKIERTGSQASSNWIVTDNGFLQFRAGGASPGTTRMFVDSAGRVGIRVIAPIASSAALALRASSTGTGGHCIELQTDASGNASIGVHEAGGVSGTGILFKRGGLNGMDTESMRIDSSGMVGINETSPDRPLHVTGTLLTQLKLEKTGTGASSALIGVSDGRFIVRNTGNTAEHIRISVQAETGAGIFSGVFIDGTTATSTPFGIFQNGDNNNQPMMQFFTAANNVDSGTDRGGIRKKSGVSEVEFVASSDLRIKENITETVDEDFLGDMDRVHQFRYDLKDKKSGVKQALGTGAQELFLIYPGKVTRTDDGIARNNDGDLPEGVQPWQVGASWEQEFIGCIKQMIRQNKLRDGRISKLETR